MKLPITYSKDANNKPWSIKTVGTVMAEQGDPAWLICT
jgi:hypothetical protein